MRTKEMKRRAKRQHNWERQEQELRDNPRWKNKRHKGYMKGKRQQARGDRVKRLRIHPVEKLLCLRWLCWRLSQHAQQWWIGPVRISQTNRDLYSVWQSSSRRCTEQWHFPTRSVTKVPEIRQDTYAGGTQLFIFLYGYALSRHISVI